MPLTPLTPVVSTGLLLSLLRAAPAAAQTPAPTSPPPSPPSPPSPPAPARPVSAPTSAPPPAPETLEEVVVTERSDNLVGIAASATQGTVGARQLQQRPLLRPGEVLETVPGLIITQHSGAGKANQYFLRGFNLDHGTDFATWVAGMPINMPTHGHGQGYTDLNFLIPELISGIVYRKGSYSADQGDFSSAGTASIAYATRLEPGVARLEGGSFDFGRIVLAGSPPAGKGAGAGGLVYGLELYHNDGPWLRPDDYRKVNGVLRYSRGTDRNRFSLTAMGYDGRWNATDQIPRRATEATGENSRQNGGGNGGRLDRFGTLDPTTGGKTHRYSLSGEWTRRDGSAETRAAAYVIDYKLNLFSNFTYFLDFPETNPPGMQGDQFEQVDDRTVYGFHIAHTRPTAMAGRSGENTFGFQVRHDAIDSVGLYNTQARQRFSTTREDRVKETSIAPYFENRTRWSAAFRTVAGLRWDNYRFDVSSSIAQNSGKTRDDLVSPKLSLIFGPWKDTEYYVNLGQGFHSNDARGTTIRVDPKSGDPVDRVTPLVRTEQAEIGIRSAAIKGLQSTLSLWYLKIDSELLFIGDAGTTEASRPSRRTGIEWTNYYTPAPNWTIDADLAYARARFEDSDPSGDRIPGAIEGVAALGVTYENPSGFSGSLRLRYFGPRPLIEDNSVRSSSSTLVNGRLAYRFGSRGRVLLDIFNLLNRRVNDIEYLYASRLPGEPQEGVEDIHFHPAEKRSFRLGVVWDL